MIDPGWKPRTVVLGKWLFGVVRAVSGEWAVAGVVRRFAVMPKGRLNQRHIIVGPWCLTVARLP